MWLRRVTQSCQRQLFVEIGKRRLNTQRTLRNAIQNESKKEAPIQNVLSSYPIFNLNPEQNEQRLGPIPGDEAILTLSGGVDSSMAAYLAIQQGGLVPVRTIFMRNWNSLEEGEGFEPGAGGSQGCQWMRDWEKVEKMAKWLNVKPELVDLSSSYWNSVFAPALDDWQVGRTPNPDIACNREIKFGELLRLIDGTGKELHETTSKFGQRIKRRWLVTGHYAHVEYFYPSYSPSIQHGRLLRAQDKGKDQSYFLSGVSALHLGRSHFPLANVQKEQVRSAARALGMPTAESEESMGLCFVGKRDKKQQQQQGGDSSSKGQVGFAGFLSDYIVAKPGPIVDLTGRMLGMHSGLHSMTIGQRAKVGGEQERLFVAAKDQKTNEILVVPGIDHAMLQCQWLEMKDFHIISPSTFRIKGNLKAQIRHRQDPIGCQVDIINENNNHLRVHFKQPLSSVAQGQVCALYDDQNRECLGSGVITKVQTKDSWK